MESEKGDRATNASGIRLGANDGSGRSLHQLRFKDNMARNFDTINNINKQKETWKFAVRVTNLWTVVGQSKQPHLEMVIMDQQAHKIQVIVPAKEFQTFSPLIQESKTYIMHNFTAEPNDLSFKACDHPFKLVVSGATSVRQADLPEIPFPTFTFKPFSEILNGNYQQDLLVDLIGVVQHVTHMKRNGNPKKVTLTLKDISGYSLQCTLWDDYAQQFFTYQDQNPTTQPIIILLNLAKIKPPQEKYNQPVSVSNAWNGTKLFINENLPDIQDYINRFPIHTLSQPSSEIMSQASGSSQLTQYSQLDKFLYNAMPKSLYEINRLTQDTVCVTVATTAMLLVNPNGWSYSGCPNLSSSFGTTLQNDGNYKCKCGLISANTVPRYKVEIKVIDKQEETRLLFWNPHVVDLLGVTAADLKQRMLEVGEDDPKVYPALLDELLGRQLAFRLRAKPGNKISILAVSEDPNYIQAILPLIQSHQIPSMIKAAINEVDQQITFTSQSLSDMAEHDPEHKDQITPAKRTYGTLNLEECQTQELGTPQMSSNKNKNNNN